MSTNVHIPDLSTIHPCDLDEVVGGGWKKTLLKYAGAAVGGAAGAYVGTVAGTAAGAFVGGPPGAGVGAIVGGGAGGGLGAAAGYDGGEKLGEWIEGKEVKTRWVNPS